MHAGYRASNNELEYSTVEKTSRSSLIQKRAPVLELPSNNVQSRKVVGLAPQNASVNFKRSLVRKHSRGDVSTNTKTTIASTNQNSRVLIRKVFNRLT